MRPRGSRYLVPAVALLVTFVAGGLLFFAVFALTDSDEDVPFEAVTVTAVPPTATSAALPPTGSPTTAATSTPAPSASAAPTASIPTTAATAQPTATLAATQPPSAAAPASFAGNWRVVDTVLGGQGAGQTYAFFVSITQTGAELRGGAPGAIEFSGTVAANIATVQFAQPTLGVTGIFIWTLNADGNASGTFTSSIPNSGASELIRLR